jgi:hypothetical protein
VQPQDGSADRTGGTDFDGIEQCGRHLPSMHQLTLGLLQARRILAAP